MRIGLYGMPAAGKTYILNQIDFIETAAGGRLLRECDPDFDSRDETGRETARKAFAKKMAQKESFIMDGHYAFGSETAFTEDDGRMYDAFLYLYISPEILKTRMESSEKNRKYLRYDIEKWQDDEIVSLREYCHRHNKDFYVIDNPLENSFSDVSEVVRFIRDIVSGYSCVAYAKKCTNEILKQSHSEIILLFDGDKTLTKEDSSNAVFGYKTHLYDGNFYTGYQAWRQSEEFKQYRFPAEDKMSVRINEIVRKQIGEASFILTSGHERVWNYIAGQLNIPYFGGMEMSAETKFFITKRLQEAGKTVIAYGDGMNDYYMLKQADKGFLVTKSDGSISKSLKGKNVEGLIFV